MKCVHCGVVFAPANRQGLCWDCREELDRARTGEGAHDTSRDAWGRKHEDCPRWKGTNCLRSCVATMLGAGDIMAVPDPTIDYFNEDYDHRNPWFEAYNQKLADACGHRLAPLKPHECPPRGHGLWIAGIRLEDELYSHAVVCRELIVWHDPAGIVRGTLDKRSLVKGFELTPTHRAIRTLSPQGIGIAMVRT